MQLDAKQTKLAIAVVVLLVLGVGYFIWSHRPASEPTEIAGQSIAAPMGAATRKPPPGQDMSGPSSTAMERMRRFQRPAGSQ